VTTRFGGPYSTPLDQFVKAPIDAEGLMPGGNSVLLHASGQLPAGLPPGIYRLRLDVGVAKAAPTTPSTATALRPSRFSGGRSRNRSSIRLRFRPTARR